jgi:hypothetical protein
MVRRLISRWQRCNEQRRWWCNHGVVKVRSGQASLIMQLFTTGTGTSLVTITTSNNQQINLVWIKLICFFFSPKGRNYLPDLESRLCRDTNNYKQSTWNSQYKYKECIKRDYHNLRRWRTETEKATHAYKYLGLELTTTHCLINKPSI